VTAPIAVWHGLADVVVPPALSQRLAADQPRAALTLLPGQGHYTCLHRNTRAALAFLFPDAGVTETPDAESPPDAESVPEPAAATVAAAAV
jgi:pimeloyl-ACP methyl ester carboxylesterase